MTGLFGRRFCRLCVSSLLYFSYMAYDPHWAELRRLYRVKVTKVLQDIRNGSVDELDLDKLHNFCMDSLVLMSKVPESVWRKAEKDAQIAGLLQEIHEAEG